MFTKTGGRQQAAHGPVCWPLLYSSGYETFVHFLIKEKSRVLSPDLFPQNLALVFFINSLGNWAAPQYVEAIML